MIDIVIGDIHSRLDAARELLEKIGVITINSGDPMTDTRNPGFRLHQLGDAVSLGYGEQEATFWYWWMRVVQDHDILLIGNHELPAFFHEPGMQFDGYAQHDVVVHSEVRRLFMQGRYKVASHVGPWLLTHAGLRVKYQHEYSLHTSKQAEVKLERLFEDAMKNRTPSQPFHPICGTDSGRGGIFWLRWDHLRAGYHEKHVPQIVGHSPQGPLLHKTGNLWLLDTTPTKEWRRLARKGLRPGRYEWGSVAALVFQDGPDEPPTLVTVGQPELEG